MNNNQIDVDAILREMHGTRRDVAIEMINEGTDPLIMMEDDQYSLEELIEELELEHDIEFNI